MKNTSVSKYTCESKRYFITRTLQIIKVTLLLVITFCIEANASNATPQITLSVRNMPLDEIFEEIHLQSGYQFFYNDDLIKQTPPITVNIKNASIDEALRQCLSGLPLSYRIKARTIIIKPGIQQEFIPALPPPVTITGKVTDESGKPLAHVSVLVKGSEKGTQTNEQGEFNLVVPNKNSVLIISSVGYEIQEVKADVKTPLHLILRKKVAAIDEVVVIGYGAIKQKNVSGAVSRVKASDLDISTSSNFAQSMQGKAAGVQVFQSTGQPGGSANITIRSNPSNANAGVLYVIDGVPVNDVANIPGTPGNNLGGTDQSPLNFINPNDIETVDFLKDASAAAVYGARAGAGVVLITTKRGKTGKPSIQYNGNYGFQKAAKMFQVLDTKTYMQQANLIGQEMWMQKNKIAPYYGNVDPATVTPPYMQMFSQQQIDTTTAYPNAMDAITRNGYTQQHNLSISSNNGKTNYLISGNYFDQKGVIIATDYKRYNGRVNLEQVISPKIKAGINVFASNSIAHTTGTGGKFEGSGIISAALYYPPTIPLVTPDGTYPINPRYTPSPNPLSYQTVTNILKSGRLLANAYGTWEIISGLVAKANFSYDQSAIKRNVYEPKTFAPGAAVGGMASMGNNVSNTKLIEYTLNYNRNIGKRQSINALLGYSYNITDKEDQYQQNQNFVSDLFFYYNMGAGQNLSPGVYSSKSQVVWASYIARAIYTLDEKYSLQASLRRDGSSIFAQNKKWGYFPGVSLSWLISGEKFMENVHVINMLKLRLSYGEVGNSNIGGNAFAIYNIGLNPTFGQNSPATGISLGQAANPNLTWETAADLNAGLDFSLLKNRITGSVDFFNRTIRNLLTQIPQPADFVVSYIWGNAGASRAIGYDIGLLSRNIVSLQSGGFTWSTGLNFSHYKSYWIKRSSQSLATLPRYVEATGKQALFNGAWGFISEGLYKGNFDKGPAQMPDVTPGTLTLTDIHSYDDKGNLAGPDGKITDADQTLLGDLNPKFNFGISNSFTYKNFDLNIFFSGAVKKSWSPYSPNNDLRVASLAANMGTYGWNTMPVSLSRWSFQNTDNNFPSGLSDSKYASFQNKSNYWFIDASFLRCRNITLGYHLPANLLSRQKIINSLRISFDMQNPFTITKFPGLDPELDMNNYYPLAKTFALGINASF